MSKRSILAASFVTLGFVTLLLTANLSRAEDALIFREMCDASAATAIDAEHFLVADDEENVLRLYGSAGGEPKGKFDLNAFLGAKKKSEEADLEGAAQLGELNFWIGSHGRNSKAKESPHRQTLFATKAVKKGDAWSVEPVGQPYTGLLDDLLADSRLGKFGLKAASELAPKSEGALNIEGLVSTPDGHLWIGFRNPLPENRAIVVPLLNPLEVIEGKKAKLGDPITLDLGGLGIRSIGRHKGKYLIIAGAYNEEQMPKLFVWAGDASAPKEAGGIQLGGLNPEGLAFRRGDEERYLILSDDGGEVIGGKDCKKLKDSSLKRFRGTWLQL
jgi:hypothetical protein